MLAAKLSLQEFCHSKISSHHAIIESKNIVNVFIEYFDEVVFVYPSLFFLILRVSFVFFKKITMKLL